MKVQVQKTYQSLVTLAGLVLLFLLCNSLSLLAQDPLVIDDTGKVGIGTNFPVGKLTVLDTSRNSITIKTSLNSKSNGIAFQNEGYAYSWNIFRADAVIPASQAHLIFSGGVPNSDILSLPERMRITNTGNVGIGTPTPGNYRLNVNGPLFASTATFNGKVGIGTTSPQNLLDLGTRYGKKLAVHQNTAGSNFYGFGISGGTLEIHAASSASAGPKMVIKNTGNVGIGTLSPSAKLDIAGNVKITDGTQGAGKLLVSDANGLASWSSDISSGNGHASTTGKTICTSKIGEKGAMILFTGRTAASKGDFSMLIHISQNNSVLAMSTGNLSSINQSGGNDSFDIKSPGNSSRYRIKFSRSNGTLTLKYDKGSNSRGWIQGSVLVLSNNN